MARPFSVCARADGVVERTWVPSGRRPEPRLFEFPSFLSQFETRFLNEILLLSEIQIIEARPRRSERVTSGAEHPRLEPMAGFPAGAFGFTNGVSGFAKVPAGFTDVVSGFANVVSGFTEVVAGFANVVSGLANVVSGFTDVASGFTKVVSGFTNVVFGLTKVVFGFTNVASGFANGGSGSEKRVGKK